jgi:SAM-dependent methyltransferase
VSSEALKELMARCGATQAPEAFVRAVSNAYHELQASVYDRLHLEARNLVTREAAPMIDALDLPAKASVLDIGCGTGFASGLILQRVGARVEKLVCADVSAHMLEMCRRKFDGDGRVSYLRMDSRELRDRGEAFDLVVTCSVVHHVTDLESFFDDITALVADGGHYLMLDEPSASFQRNPECADLARRYAAHARARRRLRFLDPAAYASKLARLLRREKPFSVDAVNALLLEKNIIRHSLAPVEIGRLVDVHDPVNEPNLLFRGAGSFALEDMATRYLQAFQLARVHSYGFLGYVDESLASRPWREEARELARRFPSCGSTICSAWRRAPRGH